jgi:RNA polymerase sigma-70 factor (ECF subfamily)
MSVTKQDSRSDRELIKWMANGDQSAFNQLYDRYSKPIYNYILRLINESNFSEDILQETFIAVWQNAGRFRGEAKVKTWLFRIAHNKAVSWLRRYRKQIRDHEQIKAETGIQSSDPQSEAQSVESISIHKWQIEQLTNALNQLSTTHRAVIELTFIHSFSYKEIGNILGCPVGTVKSRMSYAMQHLRCELIRREANEV